MAGSKNALEIKRIRNEILVALKVIYPAPMQAERLMRSLLTLFPVLEFDTFKRNLHYLCAKGYIERVVSGSEDDPEFTPWRRRCFRLTPTGMEIADHCIQDPALLE